MTEITRKKLFHLQKRFRSRSWRQSIVDCCREGDSTKEILRVKKAHRWDKKNEERSEDWSPRNAQKLHCCSRYKEYPGIWYQTHRVVGDARDIRHLHQSYHQSTETRRTTNQAIQATAHLRHRQRKLRAKIRSQQQTTMGGECSCCTCRECVAGSDSENSFQVVYTDKASSWIYDTGRAFTGKASARRRPEDGRFEV